LNKFILINLFAGIDNITDRIPSDGYSGVTRMCSIPVLAFIMAASVSGSSEPLSL